MPFEVNDRPQPLPNIKVAILLLVCIHWITDAEDFNMCDTYSKLFTDSKCMFTYFNKTNFLKMAMKRKNNIISAVASTTHNSKFLIEFYIITGLNSLANNETSHINNHGNTNKTNICYVQDTNCTLSLESIMDSAFMHEMIYLANDIKNSQQTIYYRVKLRHPEQQFFVFFRIFLQIILHSLPCSMIYLPKWNDIQETFPNKEVIILSD